VKTVFLGVKSVFLGVLGLFWMFWVFWAIWPWWPNPTHIHREIRPDSCIVGRRAIFWVWNMVKMSDFG